MAVKCRGCEKKFITQAHADAHAADAHPYANEKELRRKSWSTPNGFVDFAHLVTYAEACAAAERGAELMKKIRENKEQPQ